MGLPAVLLLVLLAGCPSLNLGGTQKAVSLSPTAKLDADTFYVDAPALMEPGQAVPLIVHESPSTTGFKVHTVPAGLAALNAQGKLVGGAGPGVGYLTVTDATGRRTLPVPVAVADRLVLPATFPANPSVSVSPDGTWAVVEDTAHDVYAVDITSANAEASGLAQPLSLPDCRSTPCTMAADGSFCWIHERQCTDPSLPTEFYEVVGPPPSDALTQVPVPAAAQKPCNFNNGCDLSQDLSPDRQHAIVSNGSGALVEVDLAAGTRTSLGSYYYGRYGPHGKDILLTSSSAIPGGIRLADGTVTQLPDLDPRIPANLPNQAQPGTGYIGTDVTPAGFVIGYRTEVVFVDVDATGAVTGVRVRYDDKWGIPVGGGLRLAGKAILDADGIQRWAGVLP